MVDGMEFFSTWLGDRKEKMKAFMGHKALIESSLQGTELYSCSGTISIFVASLILIFNQVQFLSISWTAQFMWTLWANIF